jgi:hypothetical protein
VRTNPARQIVLEEFQVGHSDIGTRMKVLRTDVLGHLLAFVAPGNISFLFEWALAATNERRSLSGLSRAVTPTQICGRLTMA